MKTLLERFHLTKNQFLRGTLGLAIIILGSMLFNPVVPGESNKEMQQDANEGLVLILGRLIAEERGHKEKLSELLSK